MNKVELSLLENVGDYACKLISAHPSLRSFAQDLSTEDLVQLTASGQSGPCEPVRPPSEFILEVRRVVSQKAWRQLTVLLENWTNMTKGENRLSVKEHEYPTMGILWQTLLITECKRRYEAIQKEMAAITDLIDPLSD